jgi:hypothetical protein
MPAAHQDGAAVQAREIAPTQIGQALRRGHRQQLELAGIHHRHRHAEIVEHDVAEAGATIKFKALTSVFAYNSAIVTIFVLSFAKKLY